MKIEDNHGCLGAILNALGLGSRSRYDPLATPYRVRDDFLSPAELNFFRVLQSAVVGWAVICPKVSLGDLFYAKSGNHRDNASYRNRIALKHIDYLLCDAQTMRPILGIELDDGSHRRQDRQARDAFVERVFQAAGLPLLRAPVRSAYNVRELAAGLRSAAGLERVPAVTEPPVAQEAPASAAEPEPPVVETAPAQQKVPATSVPAAPVQPETPAAPAPAPDVPPTCPKCGQPMVLRVVKKEGPHQGKQFWGCPDYPRCRGVREYTG